MGSGECLRGHDTQPPGGSEAQGDGAEAYLQPDFRPFVPSGMTKQSSLQSTVSRSFLLLTSAEFTKVMGSRPKAKDPRVPCVHLTDVDGTLTQFYVFINEEKPWRELCLTATALDSMEQQVLKPSEHMHSEQASKFQEKTFSSRVRESGQLQLINAQASQALSTIQEYKAGTCVDKDLDPQHPRLQQKWLTIGPISTKLMEAAL